MKEITDLLRRWQTAADRAEELAADEQSESFCAWRTGQAETYRTCIADLRAALKRPGGG